VVVVVLVCSGAGLDILASGIDPSTVSVCKPLPVHQAQCSRQPLPSQPRPQPRSRPPPAAEPAPPSSPFSDAGSPALEALLSDAAAGAPVTISRLQGIFPFPLDGFQVKAVEALLEGKSVVVCAPTGAGKTAIAEAAAAATLAKGQRVIYTTPLKALSNQKLFETRSRFGASRCGLQVRVVGAVGLRWRFAVAVCSGVWCLCSYVWWRGH
jgi:hypothetical protein